MMWVWGDHTTESSLELAKACEDGDVAEVKRILADGGQDVNVNFKDEMDLTPLIYATQRGLVEVVQLLILKVRRSPSRPCVLGVAPGHRVNLTRA
jgi:ankyrin repeat protein